MVSKRCTTLCANKKRRLLRICVSGRGSRIRTHNKGFGDPRVAGVSPATNQVSYFRAKSAFLQAFPSFLCNIIPQIMHFARGLNKGLKDPRENFCHYACFHTPNNAHRFTKIRIDKHYSLVRIHQEHSRIANLLLILSYKLTIKRTPTSSRTAIW